MISNNININYNYVKMILFFVKPRKYGVELLRTHKFQCEFVHISRL